jgi:hypothetical protein
LRPVAAMDHGFAGSRFASLDRHLERVCREDGGRVLADRPADHTAAERVEHDGAVHLVPYGSDAPRCGGSLGSVQT